MAASLCKKCEISLQQIFRILASHNAYQTAYTILGTKQFSTKAEESEDIFPEEANFLEQNTENTKVEDMIENLRNVSRLPTHIRNELPHVREVPDMSDPGYNVLYKKRKMYAKYGKSSGIDARIMWPTKSEIRQRIADDEILEPTLHERLQREADSEERNERMSGERQENVLANMKKMTKWIADYRNKQNRKLDEQNKKKERDNRLLEDAREYYGYAISKHDPKFSKMMEEQETEDRKLAKTRKKEKKQRFLSQVDNSSAKTLEEEKDEE